MSDGRARAGGQPMAADPLAVPVRPAATVMLVRDGHAGLEVFMLRRTDAAVFAAGMYVFPGGKVDPHDGTAAMEACCEGRDDAGASAVLRVPGGGLSYWVAAVRECFEEAGVLLARHRATGDVVSFAAGDVEARFERHRRAVHAGDLTLRELCEREDLVLSTESIGYVSHWITPIGPPRRFDTRFFVARAPLGQEPLHDDHETVDSLWVRPADALDRYRRSELGMFVPTASNLEFLARFGSADDAVAAAYEGGSATAPVEVLPKVRVDPEGKVLSVRFPGDAGYAEAPDYEVEGYPE